MASKKRVPQKVAIEVALQPYPMGGTLRYWKEHEVHEATGYFWRNEDGTVHQRKLGSKYHERITWDMNVVEFVVERFDGAWKPVFDEQGHATGREEWVDFEFSDLRH